MPASIALILWVVVVFALLCWDPAKTRKTSTGLWVAVAWMFFAQTRLPSQWLGTPSSNPLEDGSPIDRVVFSVLMIAAIVILVSRAFKWGEFFRRNLAFSLFILFTLASVVWSDFPLISLKRWFKDFGSYVMVLVVLSDGEPLDSVRALLRRTGYISISLSALLIKYFPQSGRLYNVWTGAPENVGATTSKNMLGALCLMGGLFFFWDTVTRWADRREKKTKRIILVNAVFLVEILWLLSLSDSATSKACLTIGCLVVAAAHTKMFKRHPGLLTWSIPVTVAMYFFLVLFFDINAELAPAVGRDATLTGRTVIWQAVLSTHTNPLFGTGYESFWLGPRLQQVWSLAGRQNEAHNGYLEVYLQLGAIGVLLLAGILISTYRSARRGIFSGSKLGSLSLALWTIAVFYDVTEAAFKASSMCIFLFVTTLAVPRRAATVNRYGNEPSLLTTPSSELSAHVDHTWAEPLM